MSIYSEIIDDKVGLFSLDRLPENIPTSEILIASLMRQLKLVKIKSSEKNVSDLSKNFHSYLKKEELNLQGLSNSEWKQIFDRFITTYLTKSQRNKNVNSQFLYLNPITPTISTFTHSARLTGNPWNPGGMIIEEIYLGCHSDKQFDNLITEIQSSLKISDNDDIWAKFLEDKISKILDEFSETEYNKGSYSFEINTKIDPPKKILHRKELFRTIPPVNIAFNEDLKNLIAAKSNFSRNRWITIIQSYLRFSTFLLVLNRISYSYNYLEMLIHDYEYSNKWLNPVKWSLGDKRKDIVEGYLTRYMYSNLKLSFLLEDISDRNNLEDLFTKIKLKITEDQQLVFNANKKAQRDFHGKYNSDFKFDKNSSIKNIKEFLEYVGRNRGLSDLESNGDINYLYTIPTGRRDYIFELGLGLVYTLVLLTDLNRQKTSNSQNNSISAGEMITYLSRYGLDLKPQDFNEGPFRDSLQELGLLIESPDSEVGVLIKTIL